MEEEALIPRINVLRVMENSVCCFMVNGYIGVPNIKMNILYVCKIYFDKPA